MRVLYFGTYERGYPRNAQVISCLRGAGVEVVEHHEAVWEAHRHAWSLGVRALPRLAGAEVRLLRRRRQPFDVLVVGYPGHLDMPAARLVARRRPLVFNPLVSLWDTLVGDRDRFSPGSPAAAVLRRIDRSAFRHADLVVADTAQHARYFAESFGLSDDRVEVCLVGAEDGVFRPGWRSPAAFEALFVGKLIPLHGVETILAAAALLPEIAFRIVGSGQLDGLLSARPANVRWTPWIEYSDLAAALQATGCALGIFGTSAKAGRVIPNKAYQALACGTPLVTADTPAARELLTHGHDALLVPRGDPRALAAAVERLAEDPPLARTIGAAGRATYERHASEAVLGARWRDMLTRLLAA